MIPEWIIKLLQTYGNCYLFKNQRNYKLSKIEKAVGKKLRVRQASTCTCGIVIEVVN